MSPARIKSYFYLLLVALIWGVAGPVIKYTLQGIDPLPFLTYRMFIASVFAVLYIAFARPNLSFFRKHFWLVVLYSLFSSTLSLGLLFLGMDQTTMVETILISAIAPLVIAEFGVIFLKEKLTRQEQLGITLALIGTVVAMGEPFLNGQFSFSQFTGNIFIFLYLITNGFSAIFSKKLTNKNADSFLLSNISFIVAFLTLAPVTILTSGWTYTITSVVSLPYNYHLGVLYMALISGTVAYALWIRGQKSIEVSEASLFGYLTPIFQAPLAIIWLGESVNTLFIIGGILITVGVVIAEYKRRIRKKPRT